jgi:hypothetical protein
MGITHPKKIEYGYFVDEEEKKGETKPLRNAFLSRSEPLRSHYKHFEFLQTLADIAESKSIFGF